MVDQISDQYRELFSLEGDASKENLSRDQMRIQLMDALVSSGRHFAFKDQIRVRTTKVLTKRINFSSFWLVTFLVVVARCCADRA